jgi:hypothetical protein
MEKERQKERRYGVNIPELTKSKNTKFVVTQHENEGLVNVIFGAMPLRDEKRRIGRDHHDMARDLYPKDIIAKYNRGGIVLGGGWVSYENGKFKLAGRSVDFGYTPKEDLVNLGPLVLKAYHEGITEITDLTILGEEDILLGKFDINEDSVD